MKTTLTILGLALALIVSSCSSRKTTTVTPMGTMQTTTTMPMK